MNFSDKVYLADKVYKAIADLRETKRLSLVQAEQAQQARRKCFQDVVSPAIDAITGGLRLAHMIAQVDTNSGSVSDRISITVNGGDFMWYTHISSRGVHVNYTYDTKNGTEIVIPEGSEFEVQSGSFLGYLDQVTSEAIVEAFLNCCKQHLNSSPQWGRL